MSENINFTATATASVAIIAGGALLISKCVESFAKGFSFEARTAFENGVPPTKKLETRSFPSVSQIRNDFKATPLAAVNAVGVETIKGRLLADLAARPYLISDPSKLNNGISAIKNAASLPALDRAHRTLVNLVEDDHQKLFSNALVTSCHKAAMKIGFTKISALPSPLSSEIVRFSATDAIGRTLITEINTAKHRPTEVETEVVGVRDGTCTEIINSFLKALETEGVRSQPPKRKFTGGVCEMAAVKRFLAERSTMLSKSESAKKTGLRRDTKRTQRLNQPKRVSKQK